MWWREKNRGNSIRLLRLNAYLFAVLSLLTTCAETKSVAFLCQQEDLQIYVNQEYVGTGLVYYKVPPNVRTAHVQCWKDGEIVYERNYDIRKSNRRLFDIHIPNYQTYSSDLQIHSK